MCVYFPVRFLTDSEARGAQSVRDFSICTEMLGFRLGQSGLSLEDTAGFHLRAKEDDAMA